MQEQERGTRRKDGDTAGELLSLIQIVGSNLKSGRPNTDQSGSEIHQKATLEQFFMQNVMSEIQESLSAKKKPFSDQPQP